VKHYTCNKTFLQNRKTSDTRHNGW